MTFEISPGKPEIQITPLDPRQYDRESFACGIPRLDNFLKWSARKQQAGNFTRVWVATWAGQSEIAGYYALNASSGPVQAQNRFLVSILGLESKYPA